MIASAQVHRQIQHQLLKLYSWVCNSRGLAGLSTLSLMP